MSATIVTPSMPIDEAICRALLDTQVAPVLGLEYGVNLFVGPPRVMNLEAGDAQPQIPGEAVFVMVMGGEPPQTSHDRTVLKVATVHVFVRSRRNEFESGQYLARKVWTAIHDRPPPDYIDIDVLESEPHYNGSDEDQYEWVVPLRAVYSAYTNTSED